MRSIISENFVISPDLYLIYNLDIEINLNNFAGLEKISLQEQAIFKFACEQMVQRTQYHNYEKSNSNMPKLIQLIAQLQIPVKY